MNENKNEAAPPVQQTGDVRDQFEAWATTGDREGPGMHRDHHGDYRDSLVLAWWQAWQAALATTRPSAALTPLDLMNAAFKHCSGIVKDDHFTFSPAQLDGFARAILAASGGAHAVPDATSALKEMVRWFGSYPEFVPSHEHMDSVSQAICNAKTVIAAAPTQDQGEGK